MVAMTCMKGTPLAGLFQQGSDGVWQHCVDKSQVFIEMKDSETGVDLCKYQLDHENKAELARNTAVVMCRIQRGAGGHWEVEAVGKLLPSGSAGNYSPIVEYVQSTWGAEEA